MRQQHVEALVMASAGAVLSGIMWLRNSMITNASEAGPDWRTLTWCLLAEARRLSPPLPELPDHLALPA